jgi:hypothetical protein
VLYRTNVYRIYLDAVCVDFIVTSVAGGELFRAFRAANLLEADGTVRGPLLSRGSRFILRLHLNFPLLRLGAVDDGLVCINDSTVLY